MFLCCSYRCYHVLSNIFGARVSISLAHLDKDYTIATRIKDGKTRNKIKNQISKISDSWSKYKTMGVLWNLFQFHNTCSAKNDKWITAPPNKQGQNTRQVIRTNETVSTLHWFFYITCFFFVFFFLNLFLTNELYVNLGRNNRN